MTWRRTIHFRKVAVKTSKRKCEYFASIYAQAIHVPDEDRLQPKMQHGLNKIGSFRTAVTKKRHRDLFPTSEQLNIMIANERAALNHCTALTYA